MSCSVPAASAPVPKAKLELEYSQGSEYASEDWEAITRVFSANAPSCGSEVLAFEKEFSEFIGSQFAIAVGNATQGLEIAVRAALHATVKKGASEIIVPTVSWISTASAAALAGAIVKFADVVFPTVCVDPESIKRLVTPRTAAVVVVHLYGRPVDGLVELSKWLRDRDIFLIEDCAHAIAAQHESGELCGSIGSIGVFSFQQQKNMVTLGEGGMCVTDSQSLRELMVGFRSLCAVSYDPKGKYLSLDPVQHPMGNRYWMMDFADHGNNFRMIDMQAAVGRAQLQRVRRWNSRRADIARALRSGLATLQPALILPDVIGRGSWHHSWHVFHVLVTEHFPLPKEEFMWALLNEFGIKTWNHYLPMHLSTAFRSRGLGKVGDCPVAETLFEQYVSLPIHPRLTDEAVQYMIDAIRELAARPFKHRDTPAPLLQALLTLSDSKKGPITKSIVDEQLAEFKLKIVESVKDGLFQSLCSDKSNPIWICRAPGRLDLMGGNDDYTGGLVFECTIAEATFVATQSREESADGVNMIVIRNRQLSETDISLPVSIIFREGLSPGGLATYLKSQFPSSRWPLYIVGVLFWLRLRHSEAAFKAGKRGLTILVWSTVPLNRGVSSSASVEVAVMKASAHAFGISVAGEVLATACQWVENQVCSSACGLMDQMAVTLGSPFMAMRCQPAIICAAPPLPDSLTIYALDSGVSHEVSGIEYEAARAAAFMGYKIICTLEGLTITEEAGGEIPRFTDVKYNGYLANMSPSAYARIESSLPESISGREFIGRYGDHVDPATGIIADHIYRVRANTKYAVLENNRVTLFSYLLKSCGDSCDKEEVNRIFVELGELMYQSHDAYTECGLGSTATSMIVDLVRALGSSSGLFGAKITGGGAGGTVAVLGLRSAKETFQRSVVDEYAKLRSALSQPPPYVFVGSSPGADAFGVIEYHNGGSF